MTKYFEYELVKAAKIVTENFLGLQPGETAVITSDTETDMCVVDAVAGAVHCAGAKPIVIKTVSPLGVGKAADPLLPVDALTAVLSHADVWIEFNQQWLLYSTPYERAMAANKELRYMCLVGMDPARMVRLIGRIDSDLLSRFMKKVTELTQNARTMRITSPAGNDLSFNMVSSRLVCCEDGSARTPGAHFPGGQISFFPEFDSINGTLVFDGSIAPPCGFLNEPVCLAVDRGRVVQISGGRKADELRAWLESFDDTNMFRLAHGCYGFNPGARLTGNVIEDERVWGCTEWGLGYLSSIDAPPDGIQAKSHCDGICMNSSVWLDGAQILENGKVIHPELKTLADLLVQ